MSENIKSNSKIDSSIIPFILNKYGMEGLEKLVGSYALAIYHEGRFYLACNYKPIFLKITKETIFFSSLEKYLRESYKDNIFKLPAYSLYEIDVDTLELKEIYKRKNKRDKVLVICSGGLDSAIVATKYVREKKDVTLLHFLYGCRSEEKEKESIKKIAERFKINYKFLDVTNLFKGEIKGSRLTNTYEELMTDKKGEKSAELAYEWVPCRNLVFYSISLAFAESYNYDVIALGNNLEESGAYPDNEMIFTEIFKQIIPYAVNLNKNINVEQPVGNLMKHEIVKLGLELKAPLDLTWSCYNLGEKHCGTCGPCYMRRKAFQINEVEEVIKYEDEK